MCWMGTSGLRRAGGLRRAVTDARRGNKWIALFCAQWKQQLTAPVVRPTRGFYFGFGLWLLFWV